MGANQICEGNASHEPTNFSPSRTGTRRKLELNLFTYAPSCILTWRSANLENHGNERAANQLI